MIDLIDDVMNESSKKFRNHNLIGMFSVKNILNILMVADEFDLSGLKRGLDECGILYRLKIAQNESEAIDMVDQSESDVFTGKPDIIVIKLNNTRSYKFEFLKKLKKTDSLKEIQVLVMTPP